MKSGDIISFKYASAGRDERPLVLVIDYSSGYVRGVNLHYLPFRKAIEMVAGRAGKSTSYRTISIDMTWRAAFRVYRPTAMTEQKYLNWSALQQRLATIGVLSHAQREHLSNSVVAHLASGGAPSAIGSIVSAAMQNPESL